MKVEPTILSLPPRTTSLLRSSIILPSLPSIASELVYNSLDAYSTSIHLTIDLSTWSVHCRDNGHGISGADLGKLERYSTSKSLSPLAREEYGFRGEALESMQDLGMLQIISREKGQSVEETWELVKRNGQTLEFGRTKTGRNEQGTSVSVRDIFYKYPVRRKALSTLSSQLSTISNIRTQLSIISLAHPNVAFYLTDTSSHEARNLLSVSRYSLDQGNLARWKQLWGRAGVEKVWEFSKRLEREGITVKGFISESASHSKANQFIFINKQPVASTCSSFYKPLNQIFASSSFARHSSSLLTLPDSSSPSRSRSASPIQTRQSGRNTPKKTVEKHPIFLFQLELDNSSELNRSYGMGEFDKKYIEFKDEDKILNILQSIVKEFLFEKGFISSSNAGERGKGSQKQVRIADSPDDFIQHQDKSSFSTEGRRRTDYYESFLGPNSIADPPREKTKKTHPAPPHPPSLLPSELHAYPFSQTPSSPTPTANAHSPILSSQIRYADPSTGQVFKIDPRTGNSWRYDPVTSHHRSSIGPREEDRVGSRDSDCENYQRGEVVIAGMEERRGIVDRRALKRKSRVSLGATALAGGDEEPNEGGMGQKEMPSWLSDTLAKWENPIFPASKPASRTRIPSLVATSGTTPSTSYLLPQSSTNPAASQIFPSTKPFTSLSSKSKRSSASAQITQSRLSKISQFFTSSSTVDIPSTVASSSTSFGTVGTDGQSFSREALKRAKFIAQVDDKYLLVKLPTSSTSDGGSGGETLVMFDQHAVSERVRVEKFLSETCGSRQVETLDVVSLTDGRGKKAGQGIGVIVSKEEFISLRSSLQHFERWGLNFNQELIVAGGGEGGHSSNSDYVQVWIETVPRIVGERLSQDPKLLQELIRGYLAQLEDSSSIAGNAEAGEDTDNWVKRVKDCPQGLVELINSKACRGAIMFNDRLRDEQARALLDNLAETKFPFTCAHGRPSIVPLANFASPTLPVNSEEPQTSGGKARIDWDLLV